jgi:hypothetical protein
MQDLVQLIEKCADESERYDALKRASSECFKRLFEAQNALAEYFRDNMLTGKLTVGEFEVKAEFAPEYTIKGGKLEAPEKRDEVISLLADVGLLDPDKIKRYQAVEVNEATLQAAFRKLPIETLMRLKEQDLISVNMKPVAKIKRVVAA